MRSLSEDRLMIVLRLLSLDYARPFFEMMGLSLSDKQYFQSVVRQCLVDLRKRYENKAEIGPYGEWLQAQLRRELGTEAFQALVDWADLTFADVPADHPHANVWQYVLRRAANNEAQRRRVSLPADKRDALLAAIRSATTNRDITDLHRKERQESLSDWDADTFARYRLGFEDPELDDPFDWVVNTANLHRFKLALAKLVSQLTDAEIEALRASVQRIALEDGSTEISDLKDPRQLQEPAEQSESQS